ncbi:MAG TPA: cupin domain-containing protein [Microvirga sp.]|jgi:uncharacterized protein YjlB|nr:cupin domain-containing protein [Microvirga sp.]
MAAATEDVKPSAPETFTFPDDGLIPNNPLPLILRRGAITPTAGDPARAFEETFRRNGWSGTWRNGIYSFHHYHSTAHEVLGIAAGSAAVRFGGEGGATVAVGAGDVVVIPAGVGHKRIEASPDLLVVGAYPGGMACDLIRADPAAVVEARRRIARVPLPDADPVDGAGGMLVRLWRA